MPVVFTISDRKSRGFRVVPSSDAQRNPLDELDAIIAAYEKQANDEAANEAVARRLTADLEAKNEAEKQHDLPREHQVALRLRQTQEEKSRRAFRRERARRRTQLKHEAEKEAAEKRQRLADIEWAWMRARTGLVLFY